MQPKGASFWGRVRAADEDLFHDVINDLSEHADIGDMSDIVVPVVGGINGHRFGGIEAGAGMYAVPELTHQDINDLYPVCSNGVFQQYVKEIVDEKKKEAIQQGVNPRRMPQNRDQLKRMGLKGNLILPAWMTDKIILASIEKWIRETAIEHVPSLRDLHQGEEECGRTATKLFLETGWNPICDSRPLPRSVRENSETGEIYRQFLRAQEKLSTPSPRELASVGLLSEWLVHNGSEETCTYTAPWISPNGFDGDSATGLSGEDLDDVHDIISAKLRGTSFDDVLTNHEMEYRYNFKPGHPKHLLDVAEQVWARMVQIDGVHAGELRDHMPDARLPQPYLIQERNHYETAPRGQYKVLDSGLAVPE